MALQHFFQKVDKEKRLFGTILTYFMNYTLLLFLPEKPLISTRTNVSLVGVTLSLSRDAQKE